MTDDLYFNVIFGIIAIVIAGILGLLELFFNDGDGK